MIIESDSKYFYDYESEDFAEILQITDKLIEFKFMKHEDTFCLSIEKFCNINTIYEKENNKVPVVKFLTEKEYLFERLKLG